jgi:glucokinase
LPKPSNESPRQRLTDRKNNQVASLTIGVDIGGTKILGGVVGPDGKILAQARRETPADSAETVRRITEVVLELAHDREIVAVGIGVAGWINADRSEVLFAPNLPLRNSPLRELVAEKVARPVVVENDANVAAWAEFRFGAARSATDSMALVTIGTGIGGGLVVRGRLVRGAYGMAGEPGHMRVVPDGLPCPCGRRGCLERYASGNALARIARERAEADPASAKVLLEIVDGAIETITGYTVTEAAKAGDPVACATFDEVGHWLAAGLVDLVYLLDPEVMVVGGGVVEAGDLLMDPIRKGFAEELGSRGVLVVPDVRAAVLGNDAGVVGAADLAERFLRERGG